MQKQLMTSLLLFLFYPLATPPMDLNGYTTAIDCLEKDLEKLSNAQYVVIEPPYFLDDERVLSVSKIHVHQTPEEFGANLATLKQHVEHLEAILADRKREKETITGVLVQLKAERAKLELPNGKRDAPAPEAENDPKKPKIVAPPALPVRK